MAQLFRCDDVVEDSAFSLLARVEANGANVTQSQVSAISIRVFDDATGDEVGTELTPSAASTIYDTLQTDARWVVDSIGYNFRHDFTNEALPDGDKTYRVEVKLTPASGSPYHFIAEISTINLHRS